ncbi:MAG: chemotaxis protein [Kordiimonas sp.]|nr:chemotaxis protein [Kordiimonas sp.]|tara:strand:- start:7082 stop:7654 length:573 start_codon:yes stop_codon:yes gene_type:complete
MINPTQNAREFGQDEIIVSKTDLTGRITYVNDTFQRVSLFSESELLGQPHNLIRHPDMPRCVFKLLWETIAQGRELFAYVKNIAANGDYYWVFAHVTPSFDEAGNIVGYHSNRRYPDPSTVEIIAALYRHLLEEENRHANAKDGVNAGYEMLLKLMEAQGVSYDEFIFTLGNIQNTEDLDQALFSFRKAS